jgi:hypothetical protein
MASAKAFRLLVAVAALWAACASAPKRPPHPPEEDDSADLRTAPPSPERSRHSIRLVTKEPPANQYRCLGKIDGVADVSDWVEASKHARVDLWQKASALGADLVKIDRVVVPAEGAHGKLVLLTGRAYRSNDTD